MTDAPSAPASDNDASSDDLDAEAEVSPWIIWRNRSLVGVACAATFGAFWYASRVLGVPVHPGFEGSLLQQPGWVMGYVGIVVCFLASAAFGTALCGRLRFYAGLFAAAIGLGAISARSGPMHYVLFRAIETGTGAAVFYRLALETALLFVPIAVAWTWLFGRAFGPRPAQKPGKSKESSGDADLMAIAAQVAGTFLIVWLLTPTDAKQQCWFAVFVAPLGATALALSFFPDTRLSRYFWAGPLVAGVAGYLLVGMSPQGWELGQVPGTFGAMARPLPVDYASLGTAGALLGCWIGPAGKRLASAFKLR